MIFDYETLKLIWWLFVGLLLIGFALTAGFDLGVGMLLPFAGRQDEERRVIINTIGPTWEGNQVWLILGAGAVFAAWPLVYAAAFSMFYGALLLALFALVLRPASFVYRSKLPSTRWRSFWDWSLFVGAAVPAAAFGMAFGNLLQGVPYYYDEALRVLPQGASLEAINAFALLAGLVSVAMMLMHGAVYLQLRTEDEVQARVRRAARLFGILFAIAFAAAGFWVGFGLDGYRIASMPDPNTIMGPLAKTVEKAPGAWLTNYRAHPWTMLAPAAAFVATLAALRLSARNRAGLAFVASSVALTAVILTVGFAMFPFWIPSSSRPDHSLTVWDGASSALTLAWMFWATVFFLPLIVGYTAWVYRVMRGPVTERQIREQEHTAY